MADIPFNNVIGTGGGGINSMIKMDQAEVDMLQIKDGSGGLYSTQDASFWSVISSNQAELIRARGEFVTTTINTSEQTIANITNEDGILTAVICPATSSQGDFCTIRITADGVLRTYVMLPTRATNGVSRAVLGYFPNWSPALNGTNTDVGHLSASDINWATNAAAAPTLGLPIPSQALELGYGIPFSSSLTVTVQMSANGSATSFGARAGIVRSAYLYKS